MIERKKSTVSLRIAICIPVLMVLTVVCSVYLPSLFITPHGDFLYVSASDYYKPEQYAVEHKKLVKVAVAVRERSYRLRQVSQLYVYDSASNQSTGISFEQAQTLTLNANETSPDGFRVVCKDTDDGFFSFFIGNSTNSSTRYLSGHNVSKQLNLRMNAGSRYDNFRFLGWIEKNAH